MSTFLYISTLVLVLVTYPSVPEIFWITLAMFPTYMILSSLFSRIVRRRGAGCPGCRGDHHRHH